MALNLMGHVTTEKRSDTIMEVLGSSPTRFQTLRTAQTMSDAGSPTWPSLKASDGIYRYMMRFGRTKKVRK